jgi:Tfp pilus assembly protein PilZ
MNQSTFEHVIPRKILLMSKFNQENFKLKDILARHLKHDVNWVRTPNQTIQSLVGGTRFDVLVINTELFTKKKLDMVKNLRAVGCDFPVIFLADVIKDAMSFVPAHLKTIVIDKPVYAQDLQGIIDRIIHKDNYSVRYHKRFSTQEVADFEVFRNGHRSSATLRNLSLGGAFLETSEQYQAGEIIKLNIRLNTLKKGHELSARVVWNGNHPDHKGVVGLGVRFVRPGEVYETAVQSLQ